MAISSILRRMPAYVGDGSASEFPVTFKFQSDEDILAYVKAAAAAGTLLVLGTDFEMDGEGDEEGGTFRLLDNGQAWIDANGNLDTGYSLFIRGRAAITQNTSLIGHKDFRPAIHQSAFDKFTIIDQQQQDELDRSVKLPETATTAEFDPTLPHDIADADEVIPIAKAGGGGWKPVSQWITKPQIDAAIDAAGDAATAQAAAEAAQVAAEAAQAAAETAEANAAASAAAAAALTGTPVSGEVPTGAINSVNTTFVFAHVPIASTFRPFVDGLRETAFVLVGNTMTLTTAPDAPQTVFADYAY